MFYHVLHFYTYWHWVPIQYQEFLKSAMSLSHPSQIHDIAWPEVAQDMAGLSKVMAKEAHIGEDNNPGQPLEALRIQMG